MIKTRLLKYFFSIFSQVFCWQFRFFLSVKSKRNTCTIQWYNWFWREVVYCRLNLNHYGWIANHDSICTCKGQSWYPFQNSFSMHIKVLVCNPALIVTFKPTSFFVIQCIKSRFYSYQASNLDAGEKLHKRQNYAGFRKTHSFWSNN